MDVETNKGTLYLVSTPIGNMEDITLRALRVLKEVDLIAAEDTRHTRKLLTRHDIDTPMVAYHQHSEAGRINELIQRLLRGESIAVVTDAGTPGISDPGCDFVIAALEAGIEIAPVPGACAAITALISSGAPTARFAFEGFLPRARSSRKVKLESLAKSETRTLIFYEAGNRTLHTLKEMAAAFGSLRYCCVGRELTKKFEEFQRGSFKNVMEYYSANDIKGEVTIIVAGIGKDEEANSICGSQPELSIEDALKKELSQGASDRDAVKNVCRLLQVSRRQVYQCMLDIKTERDR